MAGVSRIQEYNPMMVILEPTGPYSKFLVSQFEEREIPYLLVNQTQVKETRKAFGGTDNKDDRYDALMMVAVFQTQFVDNYNWRYWLEDRPDIIKEMRQILLDINSANKKGTAACNAAKQRLARGEWIGKAKVQSRRHDGNLDPDMPPAGPGWPTGYRRGNGNYASVKLPCGQTPTPKRLKMAVLRAFLMRLATWLTASV